MVVIQRKNGDYLAKCGRKRLEIITEWVESLTDARRFSTALSVALTSDILREGDYNFSVVQCESKSYNVS